MKIYDETLKNEITEPDLEKGKLVDAKRLVAHHDEQKRVFHYEVMAGTITAATPAGLRHEVEDVPYKEAWDEYEDVQRYVPYTQEELDKIAADKKAEEEKLAQEEKERQEAAAAAAEAEAERVRKETETAEKLARIDDIDAQVTYTAMMTDTLIVDDTTAGEDTGSGEDSGNEGDAADAADAEKAE